jgi:hypothetical protein
MILGHVNYKDLLVLRRMVTCLLEFGVEHQGVCSGCELDKNSKAHFPSNDSRSKGILDLVHSTCVWTDVSSIFKWLLVLCDLHC